MGTKNLFPLLSVLLFFVGCKPKIPQSDNVYQFRNYISYTTSGVVSTSKNIQIKLSKSTPLLKEGVSVTEKLLTIWPKVKGELKVINDRTLEFVPKERLASNTEYAVGVHLDKIFEEVPEEFKEYNFQFKTIKPTISVHMNAIHSYNKTFQYIEGIIRSADVVDLDDVKKMISARQEGKKRAVVWNESYRTGKSFEFKIDSIQRFEETSTVSVVYNGRPIGAENKGEEEIKIIGANTFKIVNVEVVNKDEQYLLINFSDPLKKQQNFDGLVMLKGAQSPKYIVNGNVLKVYYESVLNGETEVTIFEGIKNAHNYTLKESVSKTVSFESIKPNVRLIGNGNILPNSKDLRFNFEAVNLKAVDIRVIKIFEDNVLQFLQENNLNSNYEYAIKKVGRRIAKEKITLIEDEELATGNWRAYSVDLSKLFKAAPGAIYRVEISYTKDDAVYPCKTTEALNKNDKAARYEAAAKDLNDEARETLYWDNVIYNYKRHTYNWRERDNPCHEAYYGPQKTVSQNLLASNLGVIVKKGLNGKYHFAITDIVSTNGVPDATISLYNYQQQKIGQVKTNGEGFAKLALDKNASFAIVSKNRSKNYVKLGDGNALSLSRFNVSGTRSQKGIKGYIYGERGVWRPGDSIHLTFMLNDIDNKLPQGHPIKMEVRDPNNKIIYKQVTVEHVNQMYAFTVPTTKENNTGNYTAKVTVGGAKFYKKLKVETVKPNRLKMQVEFTDATLSNAKKAQGKVAVKWLHGAPAKNVRVELLAKVTKKNNGFSQYKGYVFTDPIKKYRTEEFTFFDGNVDANGERTISKKLDIGKNAPGLLNIQFLTRAYEKGGDFSLDAFTKIYAPFSSFVGMKSPKGNNYGSFFTDEKQRFDLMTVDKEGIPIQRNNVEVNIYKIEWRWWWNTSDDNLSSYASNTFHQPYRTIHVNTNTKGKGHFTVEIPDDERGRFLIRIKDPKSGHATGRIAYFYKNWWTTQSSGDKEAAKMLMFSSDKERYKVGDIAKITFPSGQKGRALISIENGTEVLKKSWVKTNKGETRIEIPVTSKMTPNVFVNISLLQPHKTVENDLPIRLYGTIPILVDDPDTKLQPIISMPSELEPEKRFTLSVSEKNQKAMSYTLAIVEEGLLDLTRFKTPNAHHQFYAKEALGVKTWDIYDYVIGAYSGSIDQVFAIGGDGSNAKAKNRKANRFKPVVRYLGPFSIGKGETKKHTIKLPNYIGAVRTMVIASDYRKEAYGSAEKTVPVKKPLMVLATLPRKLSPGEKVTLPITVFTMDEKVKNVSVKIKSSKGVTPVGTSKKSLTFDKVGEKMAYFQLDVSKAKGVNTIEVFAEGNGQKASYNLEFDVVNPNVISTKIIDKTITSNQSAKIAFKTFGVVNSNSAILEFSTIPQIDFTKRLSYLVRYPHGCVEQTTSSVFPQLFLSEIFDLSDKKKREIQKNIEAGIKRLSHFQRFNGGMSYWPGEEYVDDWATSYSGHFMLEAEKKGFVLPIGFKSSWISYQKKTARNWRPGHRYTSDLEQAYRLYTLALAGASDLSAMNRLREFKNLSNEAKWRLAGAYALAGQNKASENIMNSARLDFSRSDTNKYTYGSDARNRAMALETMILTNNREKNDLLKIVAKDLSSNMWMSTQTTAYSLLAISKVVQNNEDKSMHVTYSISGKTMEVQSSKTFAQRTISISQGEYTIDVKNEKNNVVYVRLINSGKLPLGEEVAISRGFNVHVDYRDLKGNKLDITTLKQGQDFYANISVENQEHTIVKNVALSQIFPSGWEIVNTRFTDFSSSVVSKARYTDIRDDRINFYFAIGRGKRDGMKTFRVLLNASYLGKYYLPGTQVEAMYDNDYFVRTKGQWVEVIK